MPIKAVLTPRTLTSYPVFGPMLFRRVRRYFNRCAAECNPSKPPFWSDLKNQHLSSSALRHMALDFRCRGGNSLVTEARLRNANQLFLGRGNQDEIVRFLPA